MVAPQINWRPPPCQYHLPIPCSHADAWGSRPWPLPWLSKGKSWPTLRQKEHSLTVLVAGRLMCINLARVQISLSRSLRVLLSDWKNSSRSAMLNLEVLYPITCTISKSRDSWGFSLYCCKSVSQYTAIIFITFGCFQICLRITNMNWGNGYIKDIKRKFV